MSPDHVAPERPPVVDALIDRLPAFDPPDALWDRVVARRSAHVRRARVRAVALTSVAALALVVGWRFAVRAPIDELANDPQARSGALETELASVRAGSAAPGATVRDVEARLARVDDALQSAYDRHAQHDELARLWRERSELEAALLAAYQRPADLVRL